MVNTKIKMSKRDFSKNPRRLRAEGKIPATIYGHNFDSISVEVDAKSFTLAFKADKTSILELVSDKETYSVLVKNAHQHPTKDDVLNIEFYRVKTDEKLKVNVPIVFINEAPGVKTEGGVLLHNIDDIDVECLPKDIPHKIEIDLSVLEKLEDTITIADLKLPKGVTALQTQDTVLVKVTSPKAQESAAAASEEAKLA